MKTPLSWISLYTPLVDTIENNSLKSLAHTYSIHTAEIDGIEDHFIDKVVVGKVLSCEKHPESKKLSIVRVALGEYGEETILTWAANIIDATYVAVAIVGAVLPWDFTIGERMMAGMMSRGMICGADEIGMSTEESTGIMILEETWKNDELESMIGKSFFSLTLPFPGKNGEIYHFPLQDTTFEIDNKFITNRPDLFSIVGNAREWQAVFDGTLSPYAPKKYNFQNNFPLKIETDKCLSYNAWKMEGITVGKSPWGMSLMMERSGLTPKMDIVDITNSIMTELGQPMHAFDADKISWAITVRMALTWEKLLALNSIEYTLTPLDMVIADEKWPIALAGVIGGMESAVSLETKNIIWESACFDAESVRLTAQKHGIRTDASTRYEKSLDPLLSETVIERVREFMEFLWKSSKITKDASYLLHKSIKNIDIPVSYDFLSKKIWITLEKEKIHDILSKLGFSIQKIDSDNMLVHVPSWRATKDISIREDIAEEVGRIFGYDHIELTPLDANFSISVKNTDKALRDSTLSFFKNRNYSEVYNYSFSNIETDWALGFSSHEEALGIKNAFNVEYTHMRRTLAWHLFQNIKDNLRHSEKLRFFEIGNVYSRASSRNTGIEAFLEDIPLKPFAEKKMLAWVVTATSIESLRKDIEWYLEDTLSFIPPLKQDETKSLPFLHPGMYGEYRLWDMVLASFSRIHPAIASTYEIPPETLYFEIAFDTLISLQKDNERVFHEISRFQTIERELNFLANEKVRTGDMWTHLSSIHPWITNIRVNSIYQDEALDEKKEKSINFGFTLVSNEGTISDKEALDIQNTIIDHMAQIWYTLRS